MSIFSPHRIDPEQAIAPQSPQSPAHLPITNVSRERDLEKVLAALDNLQPSHSRLNDILSGFETEALAKIASTLENSQDARRIMSSYSAEASKIVEQARLGTITIVEIKEGLSLLREACTNAGCPLAPGSKLAVMRLIDPELVKNAAMKRGSTISSLGVPVIVELVDEHGGVSQHDLSINDGSSVRQILRGIKTNSGIGFRLSEPKVLVFSEDDKLEGYGDFGRENGLNPRHRLDFPYDLASLFTERLAEQRLGLNPGQALEIAAKVNSTDRQISELKWEADSYCPLGSPGKLTGSNQSVSAIMRDEIRRQISFLIRTVDIYDQTEVPKITDKLIAPGSNRRMYTASIDQQPIIRIEPNDRISFIGSSSKDEAFTVQNARLSSMRAPYISHATNLLGVSIGDYVLADGTPIFGKAREEAAVLFSAAANGREIFPENDGLKRLIERENRKSLGIGEKITELAPRHWGQELLSSLEPNEIIPGVLKVDGVHWRAYIFDSHAIVEADRPGCATYIFKREALDLFLNKSRSEILNEAPEGFESRIIHSGDGAVDRTEWLKGIIPYTRKLEHRLSA